MNVNAQSFQQGSDHWLQGRRRRPSLGKKLFGQMKLRHTRMMGRKTFEEGEKQIMFGHKPHYLSHMVEEM